jgi:hypothetical protein
MQDRPTATELLAAARAFLREALAPTLTDHQLRFRTLIAANVLAIVEREMADEETRLLAEWRRLADLLGTSSPPPTSVAALRQEIDARRRDLCARIRIGEADAGPWAAAVWAYARWAVEEKLRVANPRALMRTED